jgi:hypothetical protein
MCSIRGSPLDNQFLYSRIQKDLSLPIPQCTEDDHGTRTVGSAALDDTSNKNVRTDLRENEGSRSSRTGGAETGPARRRGQDARLGSRPASRVPSRLHVITVRIRC